MLGGAVGVAEGGVDNDNPLGTGIVHIDIVDADPGTGDDLQFCGCIQQGFIDVGAAAGDDGVIVADDRQQFVLLKAQPDVQLDARFLGQKRQTFRGNFISYDNLHCISPVSVDLIRA